ncbi:hypothetical protein F750_4799 [Streptomyces sp. PAMC 26508]|nr:hypothetical protein F750_4799 [Streptomyces sp. PAMC 26508]
MRECCLFRWVRTHLRVTPPCVIRASCHSDSPDQGSSHVKIG